MNDSLIVAVFLGSSCFDELPRILSRLTSAARRGLQVVRADREPSYPQGLCDQLSGLLSEANGPVSILLVNPLECERPCFSIVERSIPSSFEGTPIWIGRWTEKGCANWAGKNALLVSPAWRGTLVPLAALRQQYRSVLECLIATNNSRFTAAPDLPTFQSVRFPSTRVLRICHVEEQLVPEFANEASRVLAGAIQAQYWPRISPLAREAARKFALNTVAPSLRRRSSRFAFETESAMHLLCTAVAACEALPDLIETIDRWQTASSEEVRVILDDWRLAVGRWMSEEDEPEAPPVDLSQLFAICPFPPLERFVSRAAGANMRALMSKEKSSIETELIARFRSDLEQSCENLIPPNIGRVRTDQLVGDYFGVPVRGCAVVTRHLPRKLAADTRDEIIETTDRAFTFCAMELSC